MTRSKHHWVLPGRGNTLSHCDVAVPRASGSGRLIVPNVLKDALDQLLAAAAVEVGQLLECEKCRSIELKDASLKLGGVKREHLASRNEKTASPKRAAIEVVAIHRHRGVLKGLIVVVHQGALFGGAR
jgi:hypothetical protein